MLFGFFAMFPNEMITFITNKWIMRKVFMFDFTDNAKDTQTYKSFSLTTNILTFLVIAVHVSIPISPGYLSLLNIGLLLISNCY